MAMTNSSTIWNKRALLGGCAGIAFAGTVMMIVASGAPRHGLVAHEVAAIVATTALA
jgi:hypothetical protein